MPTLRQGSMNVRVYKIFPYTFTDATKGTVTTELRLRMSLYSGAELSGDIFVFGGGGAELVATTDNAKQGTYGNPVTLLSSARSEQVDIQQDISVDRRYSLWIRENLRQDFRRQ